jgi:hypothetical protein
LGAILVVTYTYDHSSSSTIINSLRLPLNSDKVIHFGNEGSTNPSALTLNFSIQEPATITLVQSGIHVIHSCSSETETTSTNFKVGSQSYRTYASAVIQDQQAGQWGYVHRIDSSGASGSGISLARGLNTLEALMYQTGTATSSPINNVCGMLYLNYTSSKHSSGDGVHNHTVTYTMDNFGPTNATNFTMTKEVSAVAPSVPETNYWVTAFGLERINHYMGPSAFQTSAKLASGEDTGLGWKVICFNYNQPDTESAQMTSYYDISEFYDRHPLEPDLKRMTLETTRIYRHAAIRPTYADGIYDCAFGCIFFLTTHAITYTIAGTMSNYSSTGSGIRVNAHLDSTGEKMTTALSTTGGVFTMVWYDDTADMYVEAYEDSTHKGRSKIQTAV